MGQIFIDQMNQRIELAGPPTRIISLVPSQTELLFYLGLDEELVGITKFCVHPEEQFRSNTKVGGTKQLNFEKIQQLQPDLIIGNKEENEKTQIETLQAQYPVWMSDIKTLDDAINMIEKIGRLVGKEKEALTLSDQIKKDFQRLQTINQNKPPISVAYLIWQKPYMVAADTFINNLLKVAGFNNVFQNKKRYPPVTKKELQQSAPEVLLLSSEPFPFKEKHITELQSICPHTVIKLVDGELFSWYGNRLLFAVPYFINLRRQLANLND